MINIYYEASDGFTKEARFTDLGDAQRYAQLWMGKSPEMGVHYAASADGVAKIVVEGVSMAKLFEEIF